MALSTMLKTLALCGLLMGARAVPLDKGVQPHAFPHGDAGANATAPSEFTGAAASAAASCFPAIGFQMPASVPGSLNGWWCDETTEHAFLGFSYEVTACQSRAQLNREFKDIRNTFNGRYVRMYGFCDRANFYDDVVDAAWNAGLGVHALIWFGFEGGTEWQGRRDRLFSALHNNPKAKFVTRAVQFGSEPLYDYAIERGALAREVNAAKARLADVGVRVTVSELAYGYQVRDGAAEVLGAIDFVDAHILPFFSQQASTADKAWPIVKNDLQWFLDHTTNKKIIFSQNGWPSVSYPGVEPNSPDAVADVANEQKYYKLLEDHCVDLKNVRKGGVGWFAHIYSDNQEPGYGIYKSDGSLKFAFRPRTSC